MNAHDFTNSWLDHFEAVARPASLPSTLDAARDCIENVRARGKKLMLAGNGASATIASHYALDFTKQVGVTAISFNDSALVTAFGNDYGYDHWVARAIEHFGHSGDAAVLISSSGKSSNIVNAATLARDRGISVLAFSGFDPDNALNQLGDVKCWVDSRAYNVVEAVHAMWLGVLCDLLIGKREYGVKDSSPSRLPTVVDGT